jgi:DUF177 domain-containing protein
MEAVFRKTASVPASELEAGIRSGVEMFFSLQDLQKHQIDFREAFAPEVIDLGPDFRQVAPLQSSGTATLVEEHHGSKGVVQDIRLVGELATSIEANCARCLEPVHQAVQKDFDLLYRPQGSDAGREELSVTQAEAEIGYYQGEGLLLEDVLREQVLLAVPIRIVCSDECKGLCPRCGRNLNTETCDCAEAVVDPRWEALRKLRDQSP